MLRTPGLNVVLEVYLCPQTETLIPEKKGIKKYFCVISYWIFHFICCLWVHALHDHGVVAEIGISVGLQVWGMTYSALHVAPFITVILGSFGRRRQTPLALPQPCSTFFCVSNHRKQNDFDHVSVMGREDEPTLQVCNQSLQLCAGTAAVALDLNVCRIQVLYHNLAIFRGAGLHLNDLKMGLCVPVSNR